MLTKRCVLLLALLSILFLPSVVTAQVIGLALVDGDGKRVGPVVDFLGPHVRVYYVGDSSQATYFQFKDYIFLVIAPNGFLPPRTDVYWTLPLCQGDPYLDGRAPSFLAYFDTTEPLVVNDPALGELILPLDPALIPVILDVQSRRNADGDCLTDIQELPLIAVETLNLDFTTPFTLVEITAAPEGELKNHFHKLKRFKRFKRRTGPPIVP